MNAVNSCTGTFVLLLIAAIVGSWFISTLSTGLIALFVIFLALALIRYVSQHTAFPEEPEHEEESSDPYLHGQKY